MKIMIDATPAELAELLFILTERDVEIEDEDVDDEEEEDTDDTAEKASALLTALIHVFNKKTT